MIIACATDSNYAELAGAMLRSLAVNGDVPEAEIVVCGDRLSERDKLWLEQSASGLKIRFIDVEGAMRARIEGLHLSRYLSMSTFTRLLLPDILHDVSGRILYLDVDLIVNHSLRALFEIPLNGNPIAGVQNAGDQDYLGRLNRLAGRTSDAVNINAGVLVIDLERWRELDATNLCLGALVCKPDFTFLDQDAINAVLGDMATVLDRTWNFWSLYPRNFTANDYASAHIVHFLTAVKPNLVECYHPARDLFLAHRVHTPWRDEPLKTKKARGLRRFLGGILKRLYREPVKPRPASDTDIARRRLL